MEPRDDARKRQRILAFLADGPARADRQQGGFLLKTPGATTTCTRRVLLGLVEDGLVLVKGGSVRLSGTTSRDERFAAAHRDIEMRVVDGGSRPLRVPVNLAESPLGALMRRKGADGAAYLSGEEFEAGERLRSDYSRGNLLPRVSANWEASVAARGRGGGDGLAELTQASLAARQRVERAIEAVGPELSGVLIDVCCFLKGLEQVERERSWPVRSGKLVLKTALARLARHYAPPAGRRRPGVVHWGTADYRPQMD